MQEENPQGKVYKLLRKYIDPDNPDPPALLISGVVQAMNEGHKHADIEVVLRQIAEEPDLTEDLRERIELTIQNHLHRKDNARHHMSSALRGMAAG
jgi:hypothetical protein